MKSLRSLLHMSGVALSLGILLLIQPGCDSSQVDGRIQVLLTDEPADDILEANVTILRVEILDSTGTPTILMDEPMPFDLLKLRDGVTAELADLPIGQNTYSQMRMVVSEEAWLLMDDSSRVTLKVPSGNTSGIKLMDLPPIVIDEEDDHVVITIDFNVEDSFVKAGNSGKYIFKPVLKPIFVEFNGEMTEVPADSTDSDSTAADTTGGKRFQFEP